MFDIKIDATSAIDFYSRLIDRLKNISYELDLNKDILMQEFQQNLSNQKNPDGSDYNPLTERYKRSKAYRLRKRLTTKPLDTENYRKSFKAFSQPNKLIIKQFHPSSPTHEYGLTIKQAFGYIQITFPERRVIWISKNKLALFVDRVGRDIIKNATRS